jgi:hypothetical protein
MDQVALKPIFSGASAIAASIEKDLSSVHPTLVCLTTLRPRVWRRTGPDFISDNYTHLVIGEKLYSR